MALSAVAQASSSPYRIEKINVESSYYSIVARIYREQAFSNNEKILEAIGKRKEIKCDVLLYKDRVVGLITYKAKLKDELTFELQTFLKRPSKRFHVKELFEQNSCAFSLL